MRLSEKIGAKTFWLFSHGEEFIRPKPGEGVHPIVFDLREIYPNPYDDFPNIPGINMQIAEFILGHESVWKHLEYQKQDISIAISRLLSRKEIKELHIFFMCKGGFHRSPFAVEYFYAWTKAIERFNITILREHISLYRKGEKKGIEIKRPEDPNYELLGIRK